MAEIIVPFLLERLADPLLKSAIDKVIFLKSVGGKVKEMKEQLDWINTFLRVAHANQEIDPRVRLWISQVRDVAYEVEDIIDRFTLKVESHKQKAMIMRVAFFWRKWTNLYNAGNKIEDIQTRIENIKRNRENFGLGEAAEAAVLSTSLETWRRWRQLLPHNVRTRPVGFDKQIKALVEELKKKEPQRRVVSIIGMGGSGKTTLANEVYNHENFRNGTHFDSRGWAYVSKAYNIREVLLSVLETVGNGAEVEMAVRIATNEGLIKHLYQVLQKKLYLVFLDDVWNKGAWDSLSSAFPDGKPGSTVMLTSRDKDVALADGQSKLYLPRPLTKDEGWVLLCQKAFPVDNQPPNPNFETPGKEIVKSCGGLPLAIVVLGGLLSQRSGSDEWDEVRDNIRWSLCSGEEARIRKILDLSYYDLSYHLKACFLHLGMYVEGTEISAKKLIRVWIAEGFVPRQGEGSVETSAENCLKELVARCMVQVVKFGPSERIKTCRIHNVLREFSLDKAKEENFLEIFRGDESRPVNSVQARRLAICPKQLDGYIYPQLPSEKLRSLYFFNQNLGSINPLKFIHEELKLLRVLHLDGVQVDTDSFFGEIGKLVHLRYLGLKRSNVPELPDSVRKLKSLQILDLKSSFLNNIPDVLWKMKQLRHILLDTYQGLGLRVDTLTNLQTLDCGAPDCILEGLVDSSINLRKLRLREISMSHIEVLLNSISSFKCLRSLSLYFPRLANHTDQFPDLSPLKDCSGLLELNLRGKLEKLPDLNEITPSLTKLTLEATQLVQDPMPALGMLQNLLFLRLDALSCTTHEMVCFRKGFPKLHVLQLRNLAELRVWTVEEEAMPQLSRLEIGLCLHLTMVPEGLKHVTTLQELRIISMPASFQNRLRNGKDDFNKVKHVPSIYISQ